MKIRDYHRSHMSLRTSSYLVLTLMFVLLGSVVSCDPLERSDDFTQCSTLSIAPPSSIGFILEETPSLAGRWRLTVDKLTYDCLNGPSDDAHIWREINSRAIVLDTQGDEILWVTEASPEESRTQVVGVWVVGQPLVLDLRFASHEDADHQAGHQINLFRLIAGQVSERVLEGEAWLYALSPEVMSVSEEDRPDSSALIPVYQGQFRLTRLSYP